MIAHQGGWDEVLLPTIAVLGLLWFTRRRRRDDAVVPPAAYPEVCGYCGAELPEHARRCSSCGFRVTTG